MMYTFTKRAAHNKAPMAVKGFIYDNLTDLLDDFKEILRECGKTEGFISNTIKSINNCFTSDETHGYCIRLKRTAFYWIERVQIQEPNVIGCEEFY